MMNSETVNSSVQVAVRIRPLVESEKVRGCQDILEVFPGLHQIRVKNSDKAFTYNYVCDGVTTQDTFYNMCIKHMIENLFKGYNTTILAYGQTGSGKTHSMGMTNNRKGNMGVIPRATNDIFNYVNDNCNYNFNITVSFMELYQDVLYDLLATKPRDQSVLEIREDTKGLIVIPGLTEEPVNSASGTLECLDRGSLRRSTGSTNMNAQSSRSHAIFTFNICMQHKRDSNMNKTAKFYLVDLAGSERAKKTGATGVTFQEAVNINKGLLALGNVISALGSENRQGFIRYRDSNLTRLLKDSFGGNSITLMIACVSPADSNLDESISTLRYADRVRSFKNKPVINQGPKAAAINRMELMGEGGPIISQAELEELRRRDAAQKTEIQQLTLQNQDCQERCEIHQQQLEQTKKELEDLRVIHRQQFEQTKQELEDLRVRCQKLQDENEHLNKRLEEIKQQQIHIVIDKPQPKKKKASPSLRHNHEANYMLSLSSSPEEDDDPNADPDWRKTPMAKRTQKSKSPSTIPTQPELEDRLTVKRGSDGGCACRTNCSRKSCGCKKFNKYCTSLCKCSDECLNQSANKENETSTENTIKTPRSPLSDGGSAEVNSQPRRTKRTRTPVTPDF